MNVNDLIAAIRNGLSAGGASSAVLVVGILGVASLAIGAIAYIVHLYSPRGRLEMLLESKAPRRGRWAWRLVGLALLMALPFAVEAGMSTRVACSVCHARSGEAKQLAKGPHRSTSCAGCHASRGVTAPVRDTLNYTRWVVSYAVSARPAAAGATTARVDSAACFGCHGDIRSGTSTHNGMRVRHSDFIDSPGSCLECHGDVGHRTGATAAGPTMNQCLPCHDGKKAPSACGTCHVRDLAAASAATKGERPPVQRITPRCYGVCHKESTCLRCHGTTMPHATDWGPSHDASGAVVSGGHARVGFASREICWRCHFKKGKPLVPADEACSCHGVLGSMHGGRPWVKEHGLEATGKKSGELAECFMCHSATLCDNCHPKSFKALYNPAIGPDDYPREVPRTPGDQMTVDGL